MKLCFYLQRRFAPIGHALAKEMKRRYPATEFCGFVELRSGYKELLMQTDVVYSKLLLEEDIHAKYKAEKLDLDYLKRLEEEYGIPFLWPHLELDRIIRFGLHIREYPHNTPPYTHDEMLRILQVTAKEIVRFLDTERPEGVVFSVVGGLTSYLLFTIAKKRNIPVHIINLTRVGNRFSISSDFRTLTLVDALFEKISAGEIALPDHRRLAEKFLADFRAKPAPYSSAVSPTNRPVTRFKQLKFLAPWNIGRSLRWLGTMTFGYLFGDYKNDYSTIKPWSFVWHKLCQKMRMVVGYGNIYSAFDASRPFVFFPLQVEPEISTMLYAPYYTDQLWMAKQIAKSLPIDCVLYVKEHPAMYGKRPFNFYKDLTSIPNVRLVRPNISSFELTTRAALLIVITSTVGWEGHLLKKPVIVFGDVFYNKLPGVVKCSAISDLPNLVHHQLTKYGYNEEALVNYLTAQFKESVEIDLTTIWDGEGGKKIYEHAAELNSLVDLLTRTVGLA